MSTKQSPTITFFDQHVPTLRDGAYQVEVSQTMQIAGATIGPATQPTSQPVGFHIAGPRFAIEPSLIHSVYPPKGGKGDYHADLPTLAMTRSTLPWERKPTTAKMQDVAEYFSSQNKNKSANTNENSASWLFLLLIDETEQEHVQEHHSDQLKTVNTKYSLGIDSGELERLPERINYLTVDDHITPLLPSDLNSLQFLSYARIKEGGEEQAMIMCDRLPKSGHNSTMYLVSLENNYANSAPYNFQGISASSEYFLPYLYKWEFHTFEEQLYCLTEDVANKVHGAHTSFSIPPSFSDLYNIVHHTTEGFTNALNGAGIDAANEYLPYLLKAAKLPGSTFHELLSDLSGGFAPLSLSPEAINSPTSVGTMKLPYNQMTKGTHGMLPSPSQTWYRSPIVGGTIALGPLADVFPGPGSNTTSLPKHPNELTISQGSGHAVETTYASAFELGRLVALQDTAFATAYYQWKNDAATAIRVQQQANPNETALAAADNVEVPAMPTVVTNKITSWKSLNEIPYRYLIPDPELLPNESIRFFYLDKYWINSFLCGAFSIGHTVKADLTPKLKPHLMDTQWQQMGFLMNSLAVSGWPNFEVDVTYLDRTVSTLTHETNNDLDVNISLFLLPNEFSQLDFHLHHGKVHTGFLYENDQYEKLDPGTGATLLSAKIPPSPPPPIPADALITDKKVINPGLIANAIGADTVADFAFKMLEGKAKVQFTIKQPML